MDKRFWAVLGVIAVIVVGVIWVNNAQKNNTSSGNASPTEHIEGKSTTGVKLVEYGDYECPYCGQYFPIVKQVAAMYANQITFHFRNLPLT
jgi:protein-disulfide isomerase